MRLRTVFQISFCGLLVLGLLEAAGRLTVASAPISEPMTNYFVYLPLVSKPPNACQEIPGVSYNALSVVDRYNPTKPPPWNNPDYKLLLLGYVAVNQHRGLVNYGPSNDPGTPPQFVHLFSPYRVPTITNTYLNNRWDWDNHRPLPPEPNPQFSVTVIGMSVTPLEVIRVPDSGYAIGYDSWCGSGGCDALVLYADTQQITLRYAREDDVYPGYTVHIVGICTEPSLLSLYREKDAAGRHELPAVSGDQPVGRAWGYQIDVGIRDNGVFLDPRDCDSFWKGYSP